MLPSLTPDEEKLLLRYADPEAPAEAICSHAKIRNSDSATMERCLLADHEEPGTVPHDAALRQALARSRKTVRLPVPGRNRPRNSRHRGAASSGPADWRRCISSPK
ncbi:MAG: hypothetical protein E5V59_06580 [Mesorhizobium sp.]|nr:MAG: hypothetical protein E5V59_06580 [Mesorhizobium sp.]